MQRIVSRCILCILLFCTTFITAFAGNQVGTMDVDVVIYEDGSMYVTQVWEGDFDEGTELYIPINAPEYLTIHDLQVSGVNGKYQTEDEWNVDWSFKEKADRCGINYTDFGYEICFGISQYGHNRYAIEYLLDNAVAAYSDMDGVNFRFVNDNMNTGPTDVKVQIHLWDGRTITDAIADIWGFGFEGIVEFSDGAILAYTQNPILAQNHVTVMFSFEKGILSPIRQEHSSFEQVKQAAFEGSDYAHQTNEDAVPQEVTAVEMVIGTIIIICFPVGVVLFFWSRGKKGKQKKAKQLAEQYGYYRDIPNAGNTNATYVLGKLFGVCEDGAILATGMLRLIDLGCLTPVSQEEVGFMGKTKEVVTLRLEGNHHSSLNEYDEYLYTILEEAAGIDGVLQENELERFARKNDKLLRAYINKCESTGRSYLNKKHCLTCWDSPSKPKYLTPSGEKELGELLGFKKYLEEFSLIAERGVKEMPIWKYMLSYAMLFGIADKLAEQMKELYPNIAAEIILYNQSLSTAYSYHYLLYRNMKNAEEQQEQEQRSSGSGGFTSIGGGGGFIGGGSGGGSR